MSGGGAAAISPITEQLASYIAGALDRPLPVAARERTRQHILDTLAAIVSGSHLRAGRHAADYVAGQGGQPEATVLGTALRVPATLAALANGMAGHADETDDSHLAGRCHPGCAILPAALAVAEALDRPGRDFIAGVALGYDVGVRVNLALGFGRSDTLRHSTHSIGPAFGAAAAAAALHRLDEERVRYVMSYACQQASGLPYWNRDRHHVEKAFDFGGMPARNGVSSAAMVASGFTGVDDPFTGPHNLFTGFAEVAAPDELIAELGERFEVERASIKKWCVGSPIQAVLDAVEALVTSHNVDAADVARITITMPDDRIHIVDNRDMPDVCVQHLAALALLSHGRLTFDDVHDAGRMDDPAVRAIRSRITMVPSAALTVAIPARQAIVELEMRDGGRLRHHAKAVRGTPENPMTMAEIEDKARDLAAPVIGAERAARLVETVRDLETLPSTRTLAALLVA